MNIWIDEYVVDFCLFLFVFLAIIIVTLDLLKILVWKKLIKINIHFVFHITLLFISILGFTLNTFFLCWFGAAGFDSQNIIRVVLAFLYAVLAVIILILDQKDGFCRLCHIDYFVCVVLLTASLFAFTFVRTSVVLFFSSVISLFTYIYILIQVGFIRIREEYETYREF